MNTLSAFAEREVWHIAGWTMLHYLWLGTLVGLVAILCRLLLRRAAASVRYATALACLFLLAALPAGIATWLMSNPLPFQGGARGGIAALIAHHSPEPNSPTARSDREVIDLREPAVSLAMVDAQPEVGVDPATLLNSEPSPSPSLQGRGISVAALEAFVPYLPWLWIIGTPITFALLAAGIVGTKRLQRASRPLTVGPVIELLSRLASSLHVAHRVTVAVCDRIASPVLVGIVRPIILLPPAAISGWSPDEIEMVLLHELAHVRRWDNLVNLIQRLIESLLFFHPAVWLVSTWVRRERETCCDAFVVRRTERPHAYAELLLNLAAVHPPLAGLAFARHPLRTRIRRILQLDDDPMLISGRSLTLTLGGLIIAATFAMLYLPAIGAAEESTTEVTEDTETKDLADETPSDVAETTKPEVVEIESASQDAQPEAPSAEGENTDEPKVLATITREELNQDPMALLRVYDEARQKKQHVDLEHRKGGDTAIVVVPEPTEANWPDVLGETPRKDRVIAEKAYARLGLKLSPLTALEVMYREQTGQRTGVLIVGGNVPKGLPLPSLLTSVDGDLVSDMNGILNWLEGAAGRSNESVRCYATADDKEYLFDSARPTSTRPPSSAAASSPALSRASDAEIEILKQHIKTLEPQFERVHESYTEGTRSGSKDRFEIVAYELADAKGDLALAQADYKTAIAQYKDALKHAEAALPVVQAAFDAGLAVQSDVLQAMTNRLNIKRKLIQVQQESPGSKPTESALRDDGDIAPPATQPAASTVELSAGQPSVIEKPGVKLLLFYAANSQPSTLMQPIAKEVARQFPGTEFFQVEASTNAALTEKFGVDAVPTCLLIRDGKPLTKVVGQVTAEKLRHALLTAMTAIERPQPARKPVGTSLPNPAASDRILIDYQIPPDLANEIGKLAKTRELKSVWDERNRFVVQASREDHARLNGILKETPKWRDSATAQARMKQPLVMSEVDGEPVLEWRTAGLTFRHENRPDYLAKNPPGGVEVIKVASGSPADWQSLRPGDSLARIEEFRIGSLEELKSVMESLLEGFSNNSKMLELSVLRLQTHQPGFRDLGYDRASLPLRPDELAIQQADRNRRIRESDELIQREQEKRLALEEAERQRVSASPTPLPGSDSPPNATPGNEVTNPPAPSTETEPSTLRYHGKSFDEWRIEWQTELSTQKRLEAIKALAAFGRNGYGKEAAQTIVEIASQYELDASTNSEARAIRDAGIEALNGVKGTSNARPMKDSLDVLLQEIKSPNDAVRRFVVRVLEVHAPKEEPAMEAIIDLSNNEEPTMRTVGWRSLAHVFTPNSPLALARVREAIASDDPALQQQGIESLGQYLTGSLIRKQPQTHSDWDYIPVLLPHLLSKHDAVRKSARLAVNYMDAERAAIVAAEMRKILDDEARAADHLEAIRAVAANDKGVRPIKDSLIKFLKSNDESLRIAAATALKRGLDDFEFNLILRDTLAEDLKIIVSDSGVITLPGRPHSKLYESFQEALKNEEEQLFR